MKYIIVHKQFQQFLVDDGIWSELFHNVDSNAMILAWTEKSDPSKQQTKHTQKPDSPKQNDWKNHKENKKTKHTHTDKKYRFSPIFFAWGLWFSVFFLFSLVLFALSYSFFVCKTLHRLWCWTRNSNEWFPAAHLFHGFMVLHFCPTLIAKKNQSSTGRGPLNPQIRLQRM